MGRKGVALLVGWAWVISPVATATVFDLESEQRLNSGSTAGTTVVSEVAVAASGSTVYVVWVDDRDGEPDIYFRRSTDLGVSWGSELRLSTSSAGESRSSLPAISVSGDRVYVVWQDERNGLADIYFNASADAGATWFPADQRVNRSAAGSTNSWNPRVVSDGLSVAVVWQDGAGVTPVLDIFANHSTDGGVSWAAGDQRLDSGAPAESEVPRVVSSGSEVFVAWRDWQNGNGEILVNRSSNMGSSWFGSRSLGPGRDPDVAVDGTHLALVWSHDYDVYYNHSFDLGQSWLATATRLDLGDPQGASLSSAARVLLNGGQVVVAWFDQRRSDPELRTDVYANLSSNGGASWLTSDLRMSSGEAAWAGGLSVTGAGQHAAMVWHDDRTASEEYELVVRASGDGGSSFAAADQIVPQSTAGDYCDDAMDAAAVVTDNWLAVAWLDNRHGYCTTWDLYFMRARVDDLIFADDFERGNTTAWN